MSPHERIYIEKRGHYRAGKCSHRGRYRHNEIPHEPGIDPLKIGDPRVLGKGPEGCRGGAIGRGKGVTHAP